MPAVITAPEVPVPAPANISPVGLSSTVISIIFFCLSLSEIFILEFTDLNIPLDFILLIEQSHPNRLFISDLDLNILYENKSGIIATNY